MQSRPFLLISSRFLLILSSFEHLDFQDVTFLEIFLPQPYDALIALDDSVSKVGQLMDSELARNWKETVTPLLNFSVTSLRRIEDTNCTVYVDRYLKDKG